MQVSSPQERKGWFFYDAANSVYSALTLSLFAPVFIIAIIQYQVFADLSLDPCSAYETNGSAVECVDGFCNTYESCTSCVPGKGSQLWDGVLQAFTDVPARNVNFIGLSINAVSFATSCVSTSVIIQVFVFITLAPFADYGPNRKNIMQVCCYMGSVLTMLFITVVDSNSYGYAGFLFVFSNVFFGSSIVFYNAYLPFLVEAHEDLAEASKKGLPASELEAKKAQLSDEMSSHGFAYGYGTSVCLLIISFIIQLFVPNSKENNNVSDRICIFISGIWWLAVSQYSFKHLLPRPGPECPAENFLGKLTFGWRKLYTTLGEAKRLKHTGNFLLNYFLFSDGFGTIGSVGIIFAQTEFCLPSTALAALVLMITFLALAGNLLFLKLQQRFDLSAKFMMVLMLSISCILPLWGIIGLFSQSFGLRSIGEVFGFSFLYGLILGSLQSYSRTLFCSVIPKGSESQFFGLYEITDKGSSWIGPLVLSAVYAKTGELRYALIFLFFMLFIPCVMISFFVDFEEGKKAAGRSVEAVANTSASEQELGKAGESN